MLSTLETLITRGIRISVTVDYQPAFSKPAEAQFIFSYEITIENQSNLTVQLLRRHWHILDSLGIAREVEGEGVVGQQPILNPGECHVYQSWCPLRTPIGLMTGTYLMENGEDHSTFLVRIPEFRLVAPFVCN